MRKALTLSVGFPAVIITSNAAPKLFRSLWVAYHLFPHWRLSVFCFRPPRLKQVPLALGVGVLLYSIRILLSRSGYRLLYVTLDGGALVLCTNLVQGWVCGFDPPIVGVGDPGLDCHHEYVQIGAALRLLRNYEWFCGSDFRPRDVPSSRIFDL